jgi:NAD(P) transhydrogenase subunit alpha
MKVFAPRETHVGETRAALVPEAVRRLVAAGIEAVVERGIGLAAGFPDEAYSQAGASVVSRPVIEDAGIVVRLRPPDGLAVAAVPQGAVLIAMLDPLRNPSRVAALAGGGVSAVSMELIPRTTLAQKMDVLSSQASLAGYVAVVMAAGRLDRVFPMMTTPAGTLKPARVFVIGAGVAGLQAIATARRLGARVDAYDTRPIVAEQVRSLGARFVQLDLCETGQTKDGYARALTEEQLSRQREGLARQCAESDVVIAAAQVFGGKAPVIVTDAMVAGMRRGSVVVDLAVETGGNVEGIRPDEEFESHGVWLIGHANLPGRVPRDASLMVAGNMVNFILHYWNKTEGRLNLDPSDEILKGCLVTHRGAVLNAAVRNLLENAKKEARP